MLKKREILKIPLFLGVRVEQGFSRIIKTPKNRVYAENRGFVHKPDFRYQKMGSFMTPPKGPY